MDNQSSKKIGFVIAVLLLFLVVLGWSWLKPQSQVDDSTNSDSIASSQLSASDQLGSKYTGEYTLEDPMYGTVTNVKINGDSRVIATNGLPNHETGEFPNDGNPNTISAQSITRTYPLNPVFTGQVVDVKEPGVALNGVKFDPGTAERAICNSGQTYSIEAKQDLVDLGLDFNNAHVQPDGEYHYHGASTLLADVFDNGNDLVHIGFAADGYLIYYSKSGAYEPSYVIGSDSRIGTGCTYQVPGPSGGGTITFGPKKDGSLTSDWEFDQASGDLDECNGITIDGQYIYLVTESFPYVSRCLKGEFSESLPGPPLQ